MIPRRVALLAVAALLLAGAGIAAAATRQPDAESVTGTVEVRRVTTTTVALATTTTEPAPPSTSTTWTPTTVGGTTTTGRRATTTTTRRPATTVAPPQPTSTTAPAPACTPAQIQVTASASRPSYGPGEDAAVTAVLRNRSSTVCSHSGYTVEFTFRNAAGEAFAGSTLVADTFGPVPMAPGAEFTQTEAWRHIFQPAGPHTGTAVWSFAGNRYQATASFQLT